MPGTGKLPPDWLPAVWLTAVWLTAVWLLAVWLLADWLVLIDVLAPEALLVPLVVSRPA